jgi:hypothetical protein
MPTSFVMSMEHADLRIEMPVTFVADDGAIVVNFGILTGREATQAEIDRLAQALNTEGGAGPDITIVASRRQDYGPGIETVTHQVIVEASGGHPVEIEVLCRAWVLTCAEDRHVEPLEL